MLSGHRSRSYPTECLALKHIVTLITTYPCIIDLLDVLEVEGILDSIKEYRYWRTSYELEEKRQLAHGAQSCIAGSKVVTLVQLLKDDKSHENYAEVTLQLLGFCRSVIPIDRCYSISDE